jgi:hypothetical protein
MAGGPAGSKAPSTSSRSDRMAPLSELAPLPPWRFISSTFDPNAAGHLALEPSSRMGFILAIALPEFPLQVALLPPHHPPTHHPEHWDEKE